jgi:lipopolysaccharide/colanic/teichoic acid biosynthesis glycosyltransferase
VTVTTWVSRRGNPDFAVAALLLVVTLPLLLILAIAIQVTSAGPAVIRVPRVGRGGALFGMWKLRTMHRRPGPGLSAAGDPRVTRLGRFLRRAHLDEVPQLLNVIRGDMALVGPRPEAPEYVDRGDARWTDVLAARPGIIGPTQLLVHQFEAQFLAVSGEDGYRIHLLPLKLAIDSWYVGRASPVLDAAVAVGALQELVFRRHASISKRVQREVPEALRIPSGLSLGRAEPADEAGHQPA